MRTQTTLQKWSDSLALRISGPLREIRDFREGSVVEVEISENGLVTNKSGDSATTLISEETLLDGLNESTAHADLLAGPIPESHQQPHEASGCRKPNRPNDLTQC